MYREQLKKIKQSAKILKISGKLIKNEYIVNLVLKRRYSVYKGRIKGGYREDIGRI
jgi:hypothetical protein